MLARRLNACALAIAVAFACDPKCILTPNCSFFKQVFESDSLNGHVSRLVSPPQPEAAISSF